MGFVLGRSIPKRMLSISSEKSLLTLKLISFPTQQSTPNLLIFKFREDKSNNVFREIRKCFRKTAKFKFFAKQIIYLGSPDHPLQNDV